MQLPDVFTLAAADLAWLRIAAATAIGIVCMSMICRSDHEVLMWKIYQGAWRMEDLVAFAAVEQKEHQHQAFMERQNSVFKEPA